jgi:hypothetical protein
VDKSVQMDAEDAISKKQGTPTRIVYMDPVVMRSVKWRWFIIINPTPKSNDALSQLMFVQNLTQAINLFGPESINQDYAKQRYAILTNEDYNKFFKKPSIMQMLQTGQDPTGGQGEKPAPASGAGGMANGMKNANTQNTRQVGGGMRAAIK